VCWGSQRDIFSRGLGVDSHPMAPTPLEGLTDVAEGEAGFDLPCGVRRSGEVFCLGDEQFGVAMGRALGPEERLAARIADGVQASGNANEGCGVRKSGQLTCWMRRWGKDAGKRDVAVGRDFVDVDGLDDVVQVSVVDSHRCALRRNGQVVCWGMNLDGQLGDASMPQAPRLWLGRY
jgi:hypothetical protein